MKVAPKTYRYRSWREGQTILETMTKEICATRMRYDYRRVNVLLRRAGWSINVKRIRRLYSDLGLRLLEKHATAADQVKASGRQYVGERNS